ncbi:MAG: hypothetical protein MJ070_00645 [Lachnospiraceae bacterium]|nr:hypothetical protein [Lachnospiraceae bacterium]
MNAKKLLCSALALLTLLTALAACKPATGTPEESTAPETKEEEKVENKRNIDLTDFTQTGKDAQRWLSVPYSRLVINPYNFNVASDVTHSAFSDRPSMPLNLGYLDPYTTTGTGVWLEDLLTLCATAEASGEEPEYLFEADYYDTKSWKKGGAKHTELKCNDDSFSVKVLSGASEPWQYVSMPIDIDLSLRPTLTINVDSCEGQWALKVCETGKVDVTVIGDTAKTGTTSVDLAAVLGREDRFKGEIKFFEIGFDKTAVVSRLDIMTLPDVKTDASSFETVWTPSYLGFTAEYEDGTKLEGFDTFADEDTVLRKVTLKEGSMVRAALKLTGRAVKSGSTVTVDCGTYSYTVKPDRSANVRLFGDLTMLKLGTGAVSDTEMAHFVEFSFPDMKPGDSVTFAVSLHSDAVNKNDVAKKASDALSAEDAAEKARAKWADYYIAFLNKIPLPSSYKIELVSAQGVSKKKMEQMYHIAWIFLAQNILPENPEIDYDYPQICCGKPGMWAYGDPKSAYSASWESFFGIQLLGYVDPDTAWSALEGLISLVDEDGMLGGESLPSEKAHSAWLLYDLTGNKDRLAGMYDGIGRYLDWRIENPRWIFQSNNDVNSADADFVVSALVDIEYMVKIAEALGKTEDAAAWNKKHADFLEMYYKWCFDGGKTYQYCNKKTFARTPGNTIWITKGLLIDGIDAEHSKILFDRFYNEYNMDKPLAGFVTVKHPEEASTILGLAKYGKKSIAYSLAEIYARDVCRVGILSENYDVSGSKPVGTGVRPAMFGCATMIDCVLLMNGYSYQTHSTVDLGRNTEGKSVTFD